MEFHEVYTAIPKILGRHRFRSAAEAEFGRKRLLAALARKEKELPRRAKGDKEKVAQARRLRTETTMTLRWIAHLLQMGIWTHDSNLLNEPD